MSTTEAGQQVRAAQVSPSVVPEVVEPAFRMVRVDRLVEAATNPRTTFDLGKLAELTESVKKHGVITPLIVRLLPKRLQRGKYADGEWFQIAAGHRRSRAARAAPVEFVPAIVREMSDDAFTELLNIENLQREDLNPLDEAHGYQQLLALPGRDVHTVAGAVSRSVSYVYDRLALLKLIAPARELLLSGAITVAHAILIARVDEKDQERVIDKGLFQHESTQGLRFDDDSAAGSHRKAVSVRELTGWIDQHIRFDRTAVDPMIHPETHQTLFQAQEAEQPEKIVPITELHHVPETARADERTLCRMSWRRADGAIDVNDPGARGKPKPSKTCEHSVIGVLVVGPGRGESFRVCVDKKRCRVHWAAPKASSRAGAASSGDAAGKPRKKDKWELQREKQDFERKVANECEPKIAEMLGAAIEALRAGPRAWGDPIVQLAVASLRDPHMQKKIESIDGLLYEMAFDHAQAAVDQMSWRPADAIAVAKLLGLDLKPILDEARKALRAQAKAEEKAKADAAKDATAAPTPASKKSAAAAPRSTKKRAKKRVKKSKRADASVVDEDADLDTYASGDSQ